MLPEIVKVNIERLCKFEATYLVYAWVRAKHFTLYYHRRVVWVGCMRHPTLSKAQTTITLIIDFNCVHVTNAQNYM